MKTRKKLLSMLVLAMLMCMAFGSTMTAQASGGISGETSGGHKHEYHTDGYMAYTEDQHKRKEICSCGDVRYITEEHDGRPATQEEMPLSEMFGFPVDTPLYKSVDEDTCSQAYKCNDCGEIYYKERRHLLTAESGWQQFNLEQHRTVKMCANCKADFQIRISDHDYKEKWVGGTVGHQLFEVCTICEQPQAGGEVLPHTYGEPDVKTTAGGIKTVTLTCSACGYQDVTTEIVEVSNNPQESTVVSPALTADEIKEAAGGTATAPYWKAVVGETSEFDATKHFEQGKVWGYSGDTYILSQRPDGLYYICRVPAYYWSRIDAYNPNANNSPGSGSSSRSTYTSSQTPPDGLTPSTWNSQIYGSGSSNGGYGSSYMQAVQEAAKATWNPKGTLVYGPVDVSKPRENYVAPAKPSSTGYSFTTIKNPDTYTGPKIKVYSTGGDGTYSYIAGVKASDGSIIPAVTKTETVYVHHCSWSTSYAQIAGNNQQHTVIRRSCCGGRSESKASHGYKAWTYTDLGPDLHRAERKCAQCGYVDTKIEAHYDKNHDTKCDGCTRKLWDTITWRWYDEHTPVQETSEQYYYRPLETPVARGRQDYKFTGWWTEWGGVGIEWCEGDDFVYGSPLELFASWAAIVEVKFDVSGPVITVNRAPEDPKTPSDIVKLVITAVDLAGNDHELPLQIEGESEWHASPYIYEVTEPGTLVIVARDTMDNTNEFTVNITNLDIVKPTVSELTSSSSGWTKDPLTISVSASDDQPLPAQPYRWEFTPNEEGVEPINGTWTANNKFVVSRPGMVRVEVRDAVGNSTWSEPFYVNNIDTIKPSLDKSKPYDVSTTETVSKVTGVTISLNLLDVVDPVTGMSSGLAVAPIKWCDFSDDYTTQRTKTVYENKTYYVQVKDAVGNESDRIPITIGNISSSEPVINGITMTDADGHTINPNDPSLGDKAPITVSIDASFGEAGKPEKPYSYDGGVTWTSIPWFTAEENGEYDVTIRDANGTQKTQSFVLGNVDNSDPLVTMTLFKGQPDDWVERFGSRECTAEDWVWKMSVVAKDPAEGVGEGVFQGSGIKDVYCQWNGQHITPGADGTASFVFDVKEPASYQVTVTDNAGHSVQMEKVVQWTDLSESVYGPNPNVSLTQPDVGGSQPWEKGSAGSTFNANLEDLVFGPTGAYNASTGVFTPYPAGMAGIPVNFNGLITRNKYGTAVITFNNKTYPVQWRNTDVTGRVTTLSSFNGTADAKVLGTGDPIPGYSFIPISDIQGDVKNGRIRITVREWNDEACTDLNKEGTENFYTSVQNSKPTITYTYNRATDEMTVIATSTMAGVNKVTYQVDGSAARDYTGPFQLGDPAPSKIVLTVTDQLGVSTSMEVDVSNLGLLGNTAGTPSTGTLSPDAVSNGVSSNHSSNRAADIFIIGGTRGNTDTIPGAQVFNNALS